MRKKTISVIYYCLIALFSLTSVISLLAFANAWTFAPHTVEYISQKSTINNTVINNATTKDNLRYAVYAVSNGWHVGIIVPAGRINVLLPELKNRFDRAAVESGGAHYYEIGWGDQGFYEAKEITTLMAVQAMFNSPGSVMHVVAVHHPAKAFAKNQITKFCLNDAQLTNLETFIVNSFAKNATGNIISRRPGLYGDSQFYNAAGTYHFLNSCNTWAAKALRSAGFDISPTFKLFARQVMNNMDVSDGMDVAACQATM
jgi:uncharacterized protein (TIGR02117 family)